MEFRLIDRIRERTAQARDDVRLGIGDDAALLAVPAGQELAVAIDTLVEGVHFPVGTAPADIGWKALAVNLSDLAAMGATAAWALLALTLPRPDAAFVDGLADGFAQLARQHRLALVGGDTTRGPLTLSVAVHGFVPPGQALIRAGARVGDAVLVTGTLGDAAAGLRCLQAQMDVQTSMHAALVERLNRPTPRLAAGPKPRKPRPIRQRRLGRAPRAIRRRPSRSRAGARASRPRRFPPSPPSRRCSTTPNPASRRCR